MSTPSLTRALSSKEGSSPPQAQKAREFVFLEPSKEDLSWIHHSDAAPPLKLASETISSTDAGGSSQLGESSHEPTIGDEHQPPRPENDHIVTPSSDCKVDLSVDQLEKNAFAEGRGQAIYLQEEDVQLHLSFYRQSIWRLVVWYFVCIVTAGIWYVVDSWGNNKFWIKWNCSPIELRNLSSTRNVRVRVKSRHGEIEILSLKRIPFSRSVPVQQVFPSSLPEPFESAEEAAHANAPVKTPASAAAVDTDGATQLNYVDVLEYRASTFLLFPATGSFRHLSSWRDPNWNAFDSVSSGLTTATVSDRATLFGDNQVSVAGKSTWDIAIEEVLHPFYIFQIYSIVLWCNDEYVPYAIIIGLVSIIGIASTTVTTKRAINKLKKMSRFSCDVEVFRQKQDTPGEKDLSDAGAWEKINSEALVPGDVVDICATSEGERLINVVPCDLVLLEGDCIVNESMLTGESVPIIKSPISKAKMEQVLASGDDLAKIDKHILYSGTKVVRARPNATSASGDRSEQSARARALVVRTGFSTAKGSLVRQMLFPRPITFKFYRDAFWFIGYLFVIAFIGMISTIIYFHIIGVSGEEIALRSLDVLTIAVPPALPATLSICITFAIGRLRRAQIFCLSPQRINVAGKVNVAVFDKTGTLTEEGLDVLGVRAVAAAGSLTDLLESPVQLAEVEAAKTESDSALSLAEALATTHDLNVLNGEALGEPLEVKMLEWTQRQLEDDAGRAPVLLQQEGAQTPDSVDTGSVRKPKDVDDMLARIPIVLANGERSKQLAIVRTFTFSAALRRMAVVVKRENDIGAQMYCKGAPESITGLCDPSTIPADYNPVLDHYTRSGFRVLAIAGKVVPQLSWAAAQQVPRAVAESQLQFLGLIVFENKLKPGTSGAIATLRDDARFPIKMCTGDSVLTAVSVARECGILDTAAPVYAPRLTWGVGEKGRAEIEWVNLDDDAQRLDSYTLDPLEGSLRLRDIELAVSGEILRTLIERSALETVERMLVRAKVFARMSPEQKQNLVERLQDLGYTVSFTGDGANDCGALKAADVGLSLSEAEASVAAPFTSRTQDISCLQQLIREGRSALTVSFAMFKWMACYSLCEYFTVILLYGKTTSLDNAEYIFIDVFLVLPIAIGLANTRPAKRLHWRAPSSRLASSVPVVSTLGQVVLLFLAQTVIYVQLHKQSWYQEPDFEPENLQLNTQDNTALFRTSVFAYVIAGICYSIGPPHRGPVWKNWILGPALFILTVFCFYFLFLTDGPFFDLFGFIQTPSSFSWVIFGVVMAQFVLAMTFEFLIVDRLAPLIAAPFKKLQRKLGRAQDKPWKRITAAIENAA